ncbi:hypothetical protein [uncultured Tenacibaculum sp.]|uniref:hypothetical protein n=1 Tax=uncultured Tenacibaculum sp. TaxID=174713 RepID=UPI0026053854|nr:hypothetical protein [uncultured Tenacibaculum sp.]
MKQFLLIITIILTACSTKIDQRVFGIWKTNSNYYKATYKIEKVNKKIIGKLLYYNDGTTVLHETKTKKDIFIKDLKYKNQCYVDAVSGATKTATQNYKIKVKHNDTLEVTTYIRNTPLIETWTRKQ